MTPRARTGTRLALAALLAGVTLGLAPRPDRRTDPGPGADDEGEVQALIDALLASVKVDLAADPGRQAPRAFLAAAAADAPGGWYNLGTYHLHAGDYEAGIRCLDLALRQKPADPAALTNKGLCLRGLFRYEEALACFRRARELDPDAPQPGANIAAAEKEQALVRSAAVKLFPRLTELPAADRPRALRGLAFLQKGLQLDETDPPAAMFCFSRAAERLEPLAPCHARAAMAHFLFARRGLASEAITPGEAAAALTRVRRLTAESSAPALEWEVAYLLGFCHLRGGRSEEAAEEFRRAADSTTRVRPELRADCHTMRGSALASLGAGEAAEDEFLAARRHAAAGRPSPQQEALRETAYAALLLQQGRVGEAEGAARAATVLAGKATAAALVVSPIRPGFAEGLLGMCLHEKGDHAGACTQLRACLRKLDEADASGRERGIPLLFLGKALTRLGQSAEALDVCREAARVQPAWDRSEALAVVQEARGDPDSLREALAARVRAVGQVEAGERAVGAVEYRVAWFEDRAAVYENLATLLLRMGREGVEVRDPEALESGAGPAERALHYADRGRARTLSRLLADGPGGAAGGGPLAERARLANEVHELLKPRTSGGGGADLAREIGAKQARQRELEAALQRGSAGALGAAAAGLRPREFQATLLPGEAALEYVVAEAELVIFLVTADAVRAYRVPVGRETGATAGRDPDAAVLWRAFHEAPEQLGLNPLVWLHRRWADHHPSTPRTAAEGEAKSKAEADHVAVSQFLARRLLPPDLRRDLAAAGARHLVVVPGRALGLVSFAGLVLGGRDGAAPRTFSGSRFLVEDYTVSYGQSLAVLAAAGRRARERPAGGRDGPDFLALADPVHDTNDPRATAPPGSPPPAAERRVATDAVVRQANRAVVIEPDRRAAPHWPRLPQTHPEAVRAAGTFGDVTVFDDAVARPPEEAAAVVCAGHAANRHLALSRETARAQNLLFAVHGHANADNPWLSALMLTDLGAAAGARQPAPLTMSDVMDLRLSARTVVLAGCRTGVGRLRTGEGVVGFPLAFMAAGADTVVMTQWNVTDGEVPLGGGAFAYPTTAVVVGFYDGWRARGLGRAEALCRAQRAVLAQGGEVADPYYWAAWQAYGEWRAPNGGGP